MRRVAAQEFLLDRGIGVHRRGGGFGIGRVQDRDAPETTVGVEGLPDQDEFAFDLPCCKVSNVLTRDAAYSKD
ncbi:MAG TPA: hypothetical protein VKJ01_03830 [Candidatus Solibacter sp.]|nr:hypothetical protein [Candidatus Solibacter sp.]